MVRVIIVIMDVVVVLIVAAAIEVTVNYNHCGLQDASYPVLCGYVGARYCPRCFTDILSDPIP